MLVLIKIEELYLTFAKKASAFNSWFENAEEDLTDPVRCNSLEEIRGKLKISKSQKSQFLTCNFSIERRSCQIPRLVVHR